MRRSILNCQDTNQKGTAMKTLSIVAVTAFTFLALENFASAQDWRDLKFRVSSRTFENNSILPIIVIHNIVPPRGERLQRLLD